MTTITAKTYEVREVLDTNRKVCFRIYKNGVGCGQLYRTRGLATMAKRERELKYI